MEISRKPKPACAGGDRLIDLPDSLLHAILSQLTAREAVQTCALSRRWRHVWLTAPSLDIYFREFRSAAARDDRILRQEELNKFEDFADNLLCRRSTSGTSLDTLRLRFDQPRDHRRWVRRGLKCCPAVLGITYDGAGNHPASLPPLGSGARRLKMLCLDGLLLPCDFEEQLGSELHVLQDLKIRNCRLCWISRIVSTTLKNLTVECPPLDGKLRIVAPRLLSLHIAIGYREGSYYDITVGEAPSLVEASICVVGKPIIQRHQEELHVWLDTLQLRYLCKLLGSLSNVSGLKLIGFQEMMERMNPWTVARSEYAPGPMLQAILDEDNDRFPTFRNLRSLVLDESDIGDKLETLAFSANYSRTREADYAKLRVQKVPKEERTERQGKAQDSF